MFLGFSVAAGMRDGIGSGLVVFLIFIPITIFAGFIGILNVMDIFVSDTGISRRFLGFTFQSIDWDNLRIIKIFNIQDRSLGEVTCFNFFPEKTSGFRLVPSGKIVFNDRMVNFQEFRRLVNAYIEGNCVRVERAVTGVPMSVKGL
jgi:hypothetical protein